MSEDSFEEARTQACKYLGFMRSKKITVGGVVWEIPNQSLLSYEQQKRYNAMKLYIQESDELVRWKDTKDDDGNVIKGVAKVPWRNKAGELLPDYDELLTKMIFGEDKFEEFVKLGGNPSDIGLYWAEFNQHLADRAEDDSKSVGGDRRLAAVPDSD